MGAESSFEGNFIEVSTYSCVIGGCADGGDDGSETGNLHRGISKCAMCGRR